MKVLMNNSRECSSIDSLENRRNVADVSFLYRFYNELRSGELQNVVPENYDFTRCTCLSRRVHLFVFD